MPTPKVLVVDDCRMTCLLLRHILNREGIPSDSAATGPEAVKKALAGNYALIFLDIMLPEFDGLEVARRIRQHPCEFPPQIYLMTAMGERFSPELVDEVEADGYFLKPIVPSTIRRLARQLAAQPL